MKQMNRSPLSALPFTAAALVALWSTSASAQEEASEAAAEDEVAAEVAPTSAPFDPSTQPLPPEAAEAKWERWSRRYIDRPRTLPKGVIEAGGYLNVDRYAAGDASVTTTGALVAGGYGVSDQLEVRASYGLTLDEFEAKGPLSVGAAFGLREGSLAIAVSGDFSYDLASEIGDLGIGARVRYKLTPDLALYSYRQLVMTLVSDGGKPANLRLPIGVGFQLSEALYLFGETELAVLDLKDSETQALFADYIPLTVGGVFTLSRKLEVGGLFYTDLKTDPFDSVFVEVFGRIYL